MKTKKSCFRQSQLITAIGILFSFDEQRINFFYSHKKLQLRLKPEELIIEALCFGQSEQILIKIALTFWTDKSYVNLSDIFNILDWENLNRFLLAAMTLRDVSIEDLIEAKSIYEN